MLTQNLVPIALIVLGYFSTGAWIGSLAEDDTVADMLLAGLAYGAVGMAMAAGQGLLST